MKNFVGMKKGDLDPVNNDWLPESEKFINKDSVAYYKGTSEKFYKRPDSRGRLKREARHTSQRDK